MPLLPYDPVDLSGFKEEKDGFRLEFGAACWRRLIIVYFELLENCNLRCNMCSCWDVPKNGMTHEHYLTLLGNLLAKPPTYIRLSGGVSLMYRRASGTSPMRTPVPHEREDVGEISLDRVLVGREALPK